MNDQTIEKMRANLKQTRPPTQACHNALGAPRIAKHIDCSFRASCDHTSHDSNSSLRAVISVLVIGFSRDQS